MFEAAFGTAMCFIFLMFYFDIKKIAGYAWVVDIGLFCLFIWLFKGTYAGMMTGIVAGLIVTMFMRLVRRSIGFETLQLMRYQGELVPRLRWVRRKDGRSLGEILNG